MPGWKRVQWRVLSLAKARRGRMLSERLVLAGAVINEVFVGDGRAAFYMLKLEGKESTEEFLCNPSTQPALAGK